MYVCDAISIENPTGVYIGFFLFYLCSGGILPTISTRIIPFHGEIFHVPHIFKSDDVT